MMQVPKKWIVPGPDGADIEVFEPETEVPKGLGTYLGIAGSLTAFVLAVLAFIDGDRSEETVGALVTGALILYAVVKGRMDQARAQADAAAGVVGLIATRGRKVG
jgi:hypothetical protein